MVFSSSSVDKSDGNIVAVPSISYINTALKAKDSYMAQQNFNTFNYSATFETDVGAFGFENKNRFICFDNILEIFNAIEC